MQDDQEPGLHACRMQEAGAQACGSGQLHAESRSIAMSRKARKRTEGEEPAQRTARPDLDDCDLRVPRPPKPNAIRHFSRHPPNSHRVARPPLTLPSMEPALSRERMFERSLLYTWLKLLGETVRSMSRL
jgi:hypothetical protein